MLTISIRWSWWWRWVTMMDPDFSRNGAADRESECGRHALIE